MFKADINNPNHVTKVDYLVSNNTTKFTAWLIDGRIIKASLASAPDWIKLKFLGSCN